MYRQPKHFKKAADKKIYLLCVIEHKDFYFLQPKIVLKVFEYFTLPKAN